ncbi:PTS sugar transporter subunit IIB [Proteiniclasticum ruminis]|uniref:PTS sugar transporter subunit IIB n=1 Tax=Proteiniclasticum ruminis TaxID=398199 RepID=UPI00289E9767|nr:PTS sugar transporter subunit IIB [Proteiniclasticum ruminis]
MINIVLFCSTGLSTSLLVKKMEQTAKEKDLKIQVASYPESAMKKYIKDADVVLVGPQVRHALLEIKEVCDAHQVPLETISTKDYGSMDGEKILSQALRLFSLHHPADDSEEQQ